MSIAHLPTNGYLLKRSSVGSNEFITYFIDDKKTLWIQRRNVLIVEFQNKSIYWKLDELNQESNMLLKIYKKFWNYQKVNRDVDSKGIV